MKLTRFPRTLSACANLVVAMPSFLARALPWYPSFFLLVSGGSSSSSQDVIALES